MTTDDSMHELPFILLAEDDDDDYLLPREALREAHVGVPLQRVCDGEQLLHFLQNRICPECGVMPLVVILDLNMPRKDGREALVEMRSDPRLVEIPVVVMTTSTADEDRQNAYRLGANSFINKPLTFSGLVENMPAIKQQWLDVDTLVCGRVRRASRRSVGSWRSRSSERPR